jgi:hypothetical protein
MVPEHNDERWLTDDECASEAAAADSKGKGGKKAQKALQLGGLSVKELQAWASALVANGASAGGGLPLQLAPNLVLTSLGRVEILHPAFHNDKFIFPVGFAVRRRARTPCSGGREVWHTAEVLEAPDGSGPVFRCVCGGGGCMRVSVAARELLLVVVVVMRVVLVEGALSCLVDVRGCCCCLCCCRVTPEGSQPVSGRSPTEAWQALYKAAAGSSSSSSSGAAARAAEARRKSVRGTKLYGLQEPPVQALLQALPNAAACERFLEWLGDPPPPQPLVRAPGVFASCCICVCVCECLLGGLANTGRNEMVASTGLCVIACRCCRRCIIVRAPLCLQTPEQQLAHRAIAARLQRLPAGVAAQPLRRPVVAACDACGLEVETNDNLLVECDACRVMVHMRCYGVDAHPAGSSWLCDVCRLPGLDRPPPCALCPCVGGAMKMTAEGGWCHLLCATWVPGCFVADSVKCVVGWGGVGVGASLSLSSCSLAACRSVSLAACHACMHAHGGGRGAARRAD